VHPGQHRQVDPAEWVRSIPELGTRPLLVLYMAGHDHFRRKWMKSAEYLISLACMLRGHALATWILTRVWREGRTRIHTYIGRNWPLETPERNKLRGEAMGCLRNIYRNALAHAQSPRGKRGIQTGRRHAPHEVVRTFGAGREKTTNERED
jgi:hypothetical protein